MKRIEITRALSASVGEVFDAWSDPALMSKWFFAHPTWSVDVACDFRVGGRYSLVMRAPDGQEFPTHGEYREIERPRRLVFTWSSYLVTETLVTVELRAAGDGCELRLTHELLPSDEIRSRHEAGWIGCLDSLDRWMLGR